MRRGQYEGSSAIRIANGDGRLEFEAATVEAALSWLWLHGHREVAVAMAEGSEIFLVERRSPFPGHGSVIGLRRRPPAEPCDQVAAAALELPLGAEVRHSQNSATAATADHRRRRAARSSPASR